MPSWCLRDVHSCSSHTHTEPVARDHQRDATPKSRDSIRRAQLQSQQSVNDDSMRYACRVLCVHRRPAASSNKAVAMESGCTGRDHPLTTADKLRGLQLHLPVQVCASERVCIKMRPIWSVKNTWCSVNELHTHSAQIQHYVVANRVIFSRIAEPPPGVVAPISRFGKIRSLQPSRG